MGRIIIDNITDVEEITTKEGEDIFSRILKEREKRFFDKERFFLKYIPKEILKGYNLRDPKSLEKFRQMSLTFKNPIKGMAGCNMRRDCLEKDERTSGIKISDPSGRILGQFDVREGKMTYSPHLPFFYTERDLTKFASDDYITDITFEELVKNQLEQVKKFYVHTGYRLTSKEIQKRGYYIIEKISKAEMLNFINNPEEGRKLLHKKK